MELELFRRSIDACGAAARTWFFASANRRSRSDWDSRDALRDGGQGAVYAFFGSDAVCLYVGQTTCSLKQRALYKTSCHYETDWWALWHELRFVNISDQTDQIVLETMLILALAPIHNSKPRARSITSMYAT